MTVIIIVAALVFGYALVFGLARAARGNETEPDRPIPPGMSPGE
jgi:hypothetical protein